MNALQTELPQFEAPTADAMSRVCLMFQIATNKAITPEEGYQFLSLWNMIAKPAAAASVLNSAVTETAPAAVVSEPAKASPSTPQSVASSAPIKPAQVIATPAPVAQAAPVQAPEPKREIMPPIEEIKVKGVEQPLRRQPESFINDSRFWVQGYNWKILVEPFNTDLHGAAYYVHFKHRPSQQDFNEHYVEFTARRARVHVMESTGSESRRITDEFCSFREAGHMNFGTKETMRPNANWPDGSRFRAVFSDVRIGGQTNYIYFPNNPTKAQIEKISMAKGCVTVDQRHTVEND
jgi:hypothetical protein